MKKLVAFLLSMVMILSILPMTAFAETKKELPSMDANVITDYTGLCTKTPNIGLSGDEVAKVIIEKSLNIIASKDPTGMAKWGVGKLIAGLFPGEKDTTLQDMQKMLDEGIQRLDQLQRSVDKLSGQMSLTQIFDYLNDYSKAVNKCITPIQTLVNTLDSYDSETTDVVSDDSPLAKNRRSVLTYSIGLNDTNMGTYNEVAFDQNYYKLYSLIITKYKVDLSGETKEVDLFEMYREAMRYIYDWENQAWDCMDAYDVSVMNTYLSYATLRLESLEARKYELKASESFPGENDGKIDVLENEISSLQNQVDDVRELYENSVVDRSVNYRYFWKHGYEAKFSANLYKMNELNENEEYVASIKDMKSYMGSNLSKIEKAVSQCPSCGNGWQNSVGYFSNSADKTYNVWYGDNDKYTLANMVHTSDYNNLLDAYAYKKPLGEILEEGQFVCEDGTTYVDDSKSLFMINKEDETNPVKINSYKYGHKQCIAEYNYYQPTAYGIKSNQTASVGKGKATQFFKYRYTHLIDWIPETGKIKKQIWTIDDASSACEYTPYVLQSYTA